MAIPADPASLREQVRIKYAAVARGVSQGQPSSCCSSEACCSSATPDPITANLYNDDQIATLPAPALQASLGCGNPTALAPLAWGERVLDLGSGGGIDVLLSARRVGPTGWVYGLDMTDEMLELAERNRAAQGVANVQFLKGQMEAIPLSDATVDVVISNCVIDLAADKGQVLREAFRVLKPGGRLAVSDIVIQGTLPAGLRQNLEAWVGCVAGALDEADYRRLLAAAGFVDVGLEITRVYDYPPLVPPADVAGGLTAAPDGGSGQVVSAFVRARKPA